MKKMFLFASLYALVLAGVGCTVAGPDEGTSDLFPNTVGTKWVFKAPKATAPTDNQNLTMKIDSKSTYDNKVYWKLSITTDATEAAEQVAASAYLAYVIPNSGPLREDAGGISEYIESTKTSQLVYKYNPTLNEKYTVKVGSADRTITVASLSRAVTIGSSSYSCYEYEYDTTVPNTTGVGPNPLPAKISIYVDKNKNSGTGLVQIDVEVTGAPVVNITRTYFQRGQ